MEEKEKEKKVYRYIDTDIDRDLLLKNIRHNAQSYAKHKGWSEEKSSEFFDSLKYFEDAIMNDRLSSDYTGDIKDSMAILTNGDSKWRNSEGQSITTEEYNKLSKRNKRKYKQDFFANREVASYLGLIAKDVYEKGVKAKSEDKKESKDGDKKVSSFDFGSHGLWNKFMSSLSPNGAIDTEAWLDIDKEDSNKVRATTERAKYLSNFINSYVNWLDPDLDFSKSPFNNRDTYIGKLRELQTALQDGADDVDFRLLNAIGASPDMYRLFFSTQRATPNQDGNVQATQTPQQELTTQSVQATQEQFNNELKRYRDVYDKQKYKDFEVNPTTLKIDTKSKKYTPYESLRYNIKVQHGTDLTLDMFKKTSIGQIAQYLPQIFETLDPSLKETVDNKDSEYNGWLYMPASINKVDYSVIAFNPKTNVTKRVFIGDLGKKAMELFAEDFIQRAEEAQRMAETKSMSSGVTTSFKQGGVIQYMEEGGKEGEKKTYMSFQNYEDAMNKSHSNVDKFYDDYISNPRNKKGFTDEDGGINLTGAEITRLTSALADLLNIFNPDPITSAAMSLGSDLANFGADLNEGYSGWEAAGNLVANLGLSAIGIIPFVGDALGNGTKVVRKIAKFAPNMKRWLPLVPAGIGAAFNYKTLLNTWDKIGKDGAENDLTIEDYRNIITGLQLVLGTIKNAKSISATNKAYEIARNTKNKHIDLEVVNPSGKKEVVRFTDPDNIRALRDAKSINDVNKVLDANAATKGMTAATTDTQIVKWFGPESRWYKPHKWRTNTTVTTVSGMHEIPDYASMPKARDLDVSSATRHIYKRLRGKVVRDARNANVVDRAKAPTPAPTPAPAPSNKPTFKNLSIAEFQKIAKAKADGLKNRGILDSSLQPTQSSKIPKHSKAFEELVLRNMQSDPNLTQNDAISNLVKLGLWKQGGVLPKASIGMKFPSFTETATQSFMPKRRDIESFMSEIGIEKPTLNFPKGVYQ